jgi:hypothetical protein
MIRRRSAVAGMRGEALFSDCGRYRYRLGRIWDATGPRLLFVMLNPSTASEIRADPTLCRCLNQARTLGFGSLTVVNLFSLRATDPRALKLAEDAVGAGNDAVILRAARCADAVVCAWGRHGVLQGRGAAVAGMLRDAGLPLLHLGLTRCGQPRHPLYLRRDSPPVPWEGPPEETACPD